MLLSDSLNIIKALGDGSRLLIVDSLKQKPQYVEELAERLNLAVSTISFHLKKLEAAGLVYKAKEQYYVVFHLNEKLFCNSLNDLTSFNNPEKIKQDERMLKYRDKVVRTYFKRGKLDKLPSQHKKRMLILDEILKRFIIGEEYPEKQIDNIISEVFEDYCTIRRYFVDEKMMMRKKGIYRVNPDYRPQFDDQSGLTREKKIKMDKKTELKKAYKLSPPPMGVYQVKNFETGSIFIGSAKNNNGMINRHTFELSTHNHHIRELQETWDKTKDKNIKFEILDELEPKDDPTYNYSEDLTELETLWIEKLQKEGLEVVRLWRTRVKG